MEYKETAYLQQLRMSTASHIPSNSHYHSLDDPKKEIRLLRLPYRGYCQGVEQDIWELTAYSFEASKSLDYAALSYVWGTAAATAEININGNNWLITENLAVALRSLPNVIKQKEELSSIKFLWVDAICIDQTDQNEKTHQVQLMYDIYSAARLTIAWLGDDHCKEGASLDNIKILASYLEPIQNQAHTMPWHRPQRTRFHTFNRMREHLNRDSVTRLAVSQVLQSALWQRVWILQETVAPKDLFYAYGNGLVHWRDMFTFLHIWAEFELDDTDVDPSRVERVTLAAQSPLKMLWERQRRAEVTRQQRTFIDLLQVVRHRLHASDSRDLVYSILHLVDKNELIPEYNNISYRQVVVECMREFIRTAPRSGLLATSSPFSIILGEAQRKDVDQLDIPSWAPDWRYAALPSINQRRFGRDPGMDIWGEAKWNCFHARVKAGATPGEQIVGDAMVLDGHILGTLDSVTSRLLPDTALNDWFNEFNTLLKNRPNTGIQPVKEEGEVRHAIMCYSAIACSDHFADSLFSDDHLDPSRISFAGDTFDVGSYAQHHRAEYDGQLRRVHPRIQKGYRIRGPACRTLLAYKRLRGFRNMRMLGFDHVRLGELAGRYCNLLNHSVWRRAYVTADGWAGIGPGNAQAGDLICAVTSPIPILLRPLGQNQYRYLGEVYIYGLMHGVRNMRVEEMWDAVEFTIV